MTPIKINGKIFGAKLTAAEEKALEIEVRKKIAEYDRQNCNEIDAIILWILMSEFGFGEKRLKKFHDTFAPAIHGLADRYEMDPTELVWLCTKKLLDKGIDIEAWNNSSPNE